MAVTVRGVVDWPRLCIFSLNVALVLSLGVHSASGQENYAPSPKTSNRDQQLATLSRASTVDSTVGAGDLLHIDVFDVPELSRDVRVSESGNITFPLIKERVEAAGLTPPQIEQRLEQVLSDEGLVAHAEVSVFVKEQNSQPVSVVGAVMHPVVLQIVRPTTLLEVLTQAGGVADDAGSTIVITRTLRDSNPHMQPVSEKIQPDTSQQTTIEIRVQDLIESGKPEYNIQVIGGDVVTVPRAGIVYVMGAGVAQQGEYVMLGHGDQVTVLKAVALAHGLTNFAKADSAVVMRNNATTGKRDQIPVSIKKIQEHKADDVPLLSNDILYVPDSRGKKALARGTEAMLGIGTQVAVYRIP